MTGNRSLSASILVSVLTAAAYIIARNITLPGVDAVALEHLLAMAGRGSFGASPVSIVGVGLGWLLVLWWVEGLVFGEREPSGAAAWILPGIYLALSALVALTHALHLQSLDPTWAQVVAEPGARFVLVATLTQTAGAAFMWLASRWIGWRGSGQGVLVLLGIELLWHAVSSLVESAHHLEVQMVTPIAVLGSVLLGVAPLVVSLVLLSVRRIEWPRLAAGTRFAGAVDVMVLPYVALAVVPWGVSRLALTGLPPFGVPPVLSSLAALALAIVLAVVLGRTGERALRPGYLVAAIGAPFASIAALVAAFLAVAGLPKLEPGPYDGDGCFVAALESDANAPHGDANALAARLDALDVDADVRSASPSRIELTLRRVSAAGDLLAFVLPARRLEFRMMAQDQSPLQPRAHDPLLNDLRVERDFDTQAPYFVAPSREALAPLVSRLEDPSHAHIECRDSYDGSGGQQCSAWLLDPPVLNGADVESAEVVLDPMTGQPDVTLKFDDDGKRRFGEVTGANVGKKLAIVIDHEVQAMPKIMEAIPGGTARITLGRADSPVARMQEARAMVTSLTAGRLEHDWRVASIAACAR